MRQFVVDTEPDLKGLITLTGKDFKYIRQVLRLSEGDMLKVAASNKSFDMTLCKIDDVKKKIILQICDTQEKDFKTQSTFSQKTEFWLLQFIPKPQKMELIVRQAVEAGVSVIVPVIGEYTQKGSENILGKKSERIDRIIREARQQSGSPIETKVLEPMSILRALELISEHEQKTSDAKKQTVKVCLYERNEDSVTIHQAVKQKMTAQQTQSLSQENAQSQVQVQSQSKMQSQIQESQIGFAICAVGSEGGISPSEIQLLKNKGFSTVHFNVNILRCETASLYGMAALQTTVMEYDSWQ